MLQSICGEATVPTNGSRHHRNHVFGSSRNVCAEASRDLLSRFILLRSCERNAGSFWLLDHYTRQAVATLLLARLLDVRQTTTTPGDLDHQQQHLLDRAMVSEGLEALRLVRGDEEQDDGEEDTYYYHSGSPAAKSNTEDVLPRCRRWRPVGPQSSSRTARPAEASWEAATAAQF